MSLDFETQLRNFADEAESKGKPALAQRLRQLAAEYPNTRPHCPEVLATKRLEAKGVAVCHFCGACDTKEGAIETGWSPNFWQMFSTGKPAENIIMPVCPKCIAEHLIPSEGEFITKS